MTEANTEATKAEIGALFASVGANRFAAEEKGGGWLISAWFDPGDIQHFGHTGIRMDTPTDPVEWTRDVLLPIIRADGRLFAQAPIVSHEMLAAEAEAEQDSGHVSTIQSDDRPGGLEDTIPESGIHSAADVAGGEGAHSTSSSAEFPPDTSDVGSDGPRATEPALQAELADAEAEQDSTNAEGFETAADVYPVDATGGAGAGEAADAEFADPVSADDSEPAASEPEAGLAAGVEAYPGIALLEDDLGRRRNQVLAAITARQFLLQDVAADTSRRTFLQQAAADYQNTCFLKIQPTEMQEANYREWMALEARDREVASLASSIARAALSADLDGLERIAAGLEDALR